MHYKAGSVVNITPEACVSLAAEARIDACCDRFEDAWPSETRLSIEAVLCSAECRDERRLLLKRLIEVELELRTRVGGISHFSDYAARFPGDDEVIRSVFDQLPSGTLPDETRQMSEIQKTWPTDSSGKELGAAAEAAVLPVRIGRFEILSILGRGGFGVVYKARDPELNREVAVKIPNQRALLAPVQLQRFRREARAAAAISHPSICPVYEIGDLDGCPFIVMACVSGEPLSSKLQRGQTLTLKLSVELVSRIAEALELAHRHGVIHRDLKPSNIMIQTTGEPVVTDFGLACMEESEEATITTEGDVLGSPAYMSPEQARGLTKRIGPTSDIYSLGVILFELLSGQRPFQGSVREVISQLNSVKDPPRLAKVVPEIDPQLDSICAKAMAVDPDQRFASAADFSAAMKDWLQRSEARTSPKKHTTRTAALVALATSLLLIAAAAIYVLTDQGWLEIESHDEDVRIEITRGGREVALIDTRTNSQVRLKSGQYELALRGEKNGVQLSKTQFVMTRGDRQIVTVRPVNSPPAKPTPELPKVKLPANDLAPPSESPPQKNDKKKEEGKEEKPKAPADPSAPNTARQREAREVWSPIKALVEEQFAADPSSPAAANVRWRVVQFARLYGDTPEAVEALNVIARFRWPADLLRREDIPQVELEAAGFGAAAATPAELVAILGDSRWKQWKGVSAVASTRDGRRGASAGEDGVAMVWDAETGRPLHWMVDHMAPVRAVAFSPDDTILATASDDRTIRLWDVASGKLHQTLRGHTGAVLSVAFDPLGKRLASASLDGTIILWDMNGDELRSIRAPGAVSCVAFSPSGQQLAAGGEHHHLRLWNPNTGDQLADVGGHKEWVTCVAFSADGALLGSGDGQGTAQIWNVAEQRLERRLEPTPRGSITTIAFDSEGNHVAVGTALWHIHTYAIATGKLVSSREFHAVATAVTESPQRRVWLSGWLNHWIVLSDKENGKILNADAGPVLAADMNWDGSCVVGSNREKELLTMWRLAEPNAPQPLLDPSQWDTAVAFAPDGQRLVSGGGNWTPKLWDVLERRFLRTFGRHEQWIDGAGYHPSGTRMATGGFDQTARIWDTASGECLHTLRGHTGVVHDIRFSHDGRWLATASFDHSAKIWDATTGELRTTFAGHPAIVTAATFSPDGQLLATASQASVWIRSLRDGKVVHKLDGHANVAYDADFSPNGRWLASAGGDGTVRVWDYRAGSERQVIRLHPRAGIIHTVRFTPDGRHLWTRNGNGTLYVLRLDLPL